MGWNDYPLQSIKIPQNAATDDPYVFIGSNDPVAQLLNAPASIVWHAGADGENTGAAFDMRPNGNGASFVLLAVSDFLLPSSFLDLTTTDASARFSVGNGSQQTIIRGLPIQSAVGANNPVQLTPQFVSATSEVQNNTTTLVDDLALTIPAAGKWALDGCYFFQTPAASGLKMTFVGDGTGVTNGNIRWGVERNEGMIFGGNNGVVTVTTATFQRVHVSGTVTATAAGTVTLRYAQNAASAGPTSPLANRWLRAVQIS